MKKYVLLLLLIAGSLSGCLKENNGTVYDPVAQAAADDATIKAYLAANPSIQATKDASGLYYQILTQGTGSTYPQFSSVVTVNYSGSLLGSSVVFDSANSAAIQLNTTLVGWQIGLPYLKPGGRILLIIPSTLAYGNNSPGVSIPPNSILVFTIDLISFQ